MRNRAGITQRCPTGTNEVEYSNVTKTESGRGCRLGRYGYRKGDVLTGNLRNKEEFYRTLFSFFFLLYTGSAMGLIWPKVFWHIMKYRCQRISVSYSLAMGKSDLDKRFSGKIIAVSDPALIKIIMRF